MIRYLTSLLLSVTANKLQLALFKERNSRDVIAKIGLMQEYATRARFSEKEDRMIKSLQAELGNQWTVIVDRINKTFGTDWSNNQVKRRFRQMEIEMKQGGSKRRKVDWTAYEDNQLLASRADYLKKNGSTYGMWDAILAKMPGKTKKDLQDRWNNKLSKTSLDATSLDATSSDATTVSSKNVAAKNVAAKKAAAKKATATKVASLPSDDSDGYSSYEESDGYSSSEEESDTKLQLSVPPMLRSYASPILLISPNRGCALHNRSSIESASSATLTSSLMVFVFFSAHFSPKDFEVQILSSGD